ncbi:MAG: N-acetylmuramoyl-L-alanine amidase [Candidatus Ornithomonoglobus sp.]
MNKEDKKDWFERMNDDLRADEAYQRRKNNDRMRAIKEKEAQQSAKRRKRLKLAGCVAAGIVVLGAAVFGISRCAGNGKSENGGIASDMKSGKVQLYDEKISINGDYIPGYTIGDSSEIYFVDEDLKLFSFDFVASPDNSKLRMEDNSEVHNGISTDFAWELTGNTAKKADIELTANDRSFECYVVEGTNGVGDSVEYKLVPSLILEQFGTKNVRETMDGQEIHYMFGDYSDETEAPATDDPAADEGNTAELSMNGGAAQNNTTATGGTVIVLDPGHGKSSGLMSAEEKIAEGYTQYNGSWGEWRHWKNGTADQECEGSGCHADKECWYPIGNGDRDIEPDVNLHNAQAAKKYLEQMGYTVRMTRDTNSSTSSENPSFSKRVSYCYPNNDLSATPDAACYICIHSNAGGGRGSAYIQASGNYTQKWIQSDYVEQCNRLGSLINSRITSETSMGTCGGGSIGGEGYLILFNKCPVPAGYMEIGFFDNSSDLSILRNESDQIGKAIAEGVDDFITSR